LLRKATNDESWGPDSIQQTLSPRAVSMTISLRQHHFLLDLPSSQDMRCQARLKSLTLSHAGDWLNAVPSKALGLNLHPKVFKVACQYRLGLPVYGRRGPCPRSCGMTSDVMGDHSVGCGADGGRIGRHDWLRDKIFAELQASHANPKKEAPSLIPGNASRPADIYVPTWRGRPTAFDITVISSLHERYLPKSSATTGAALEIAKERKIRAHQEDCHANGIIFVPLPVETLGGWEAEAASHLRDIGRHVAGRLDLDRSTTIRHFFQRLGLILQRANAGLIVDREPLPPPAHVTGEI
jgi:hypothetical protein